MPLFSTARVKLGRTGRTGMQRGSFQCHPHPRDSGHPREDYPGTGTFGARRPIWSFSVLPPLVSSGRSGENSTLDPSFSPAMSDV